MLLLLHAQSLANQSHKLNGYPSESSLKVTAYNSRQTPLSFTLHIHHDFSLEEPVYQLVEISLGSIWVERVRHFLTRADLI